MFLFSKFFTTQVLIAFVRPYNFLIVPSTKTYVQIQGLAWSAILVGMVAESASLGTKDSLGPLKTLTAASVINWFGGILLCSVFNYGIPVAAWAMMISKVIFGPIMARIQCFYYDHSFIQRSYPDF